MLKNIIPFAHQLLKDTVQPGDLVIDATCGNGNDTLFLTKLVGDEGEVLAFDVQEQAILSTKDKLEEYKITNVNLIHQGHEFVSDYIQENQEVTAAIFNLGYLPKSDKKIITKADTTLVAISQILNHLRKNGLVILVVYHGHPGGEDEKSALLDYVTKLDQKDYQVLNYGFINQKNSPPFILAIEKR
ncbi:tRNA (mnm(5)s(2)U34)-methyltransferase [Oceanobacillus sp. CAU 1775]